jgi:hypothetical protein
MASLMIQGWASRQAAMSGNVARTMVMAPRYGATWRAKRARIRVS